MSEPINSANFANKNIKYVFCDIDDTLTSHGKLHGEAYQALWDLHQSGIKIIPVTGRPAGWCELIVRLWPVDAVIGENGGFYFCFKGQQLFRSFFNSKEDREKNQKKLLSIQNEVLKEVPGAALASDQFTRLMDLAIDFCEDVPPLSQSDIKQIVDIFEKHGAIAKVSSIHVNGWFGDYSKISMIKQYCQDELGAPFEKIKENAVFAGDSPNDEPAFKSFKYSVGVANIKRFLSELSHPPKWVTSKEGGEGFVELAQLLIK